MRIFGRVVLAVLVVLGLTGVGAVFLTQRPIDLAAYPEATIASPPDRANVDLRFSILPTAKVTAPEGVMFEGGSWFRLRAMEHSAVLICHPKGFVLFDTGLGRAIDSQFREFPLLTQAAFGYHKLETVADVVDRDDPCPNRPLRIIPSHLHWDHAGGLEDFPGVEVWIQPEELQQARSGGVHQGFLPGEIDSSKINWHPFAFAEQPYEQFPRSLDVFGDGSLILVPMAGHTAGSVGLFLTTGGQRYFFTGDTTWALQGFLRPAHKFITARALADLDLAALEAEIVGVHRLITRDPALTVIPAHDAAAYPATAVYPLWAGN